MKLIKDHDCGTRYHLAKANAMVNAFSSKAPSGLSCIWSARVDQLTKLRLMGVKMEMLDSEALWHSSE